MTASKELTSTTAPDVVKNAARRMCERLGEQGVRIKHSQMLEALAAGLGVDNWRKLKAMLDAPRVPTASAPKSVDSRSAVTGDWRYWAVDAVYFDNEQSYSANLQARTPLEAAIACIVERLSDHGNEVGVLQVSESGGGVHLQTAFSDEIRLESNQQALLLLLREVRKLRDQDQFDEEKTSYTKWLEYVMGQFDSETFSTLTDWTYLDQASVDAADGYVRGSTVPPTEVLRTLCAAVVDSYGGVLQLELKDEELASALYQVQATCDFFGVILDDADNGAGVAGVDRDELDD